MNLLVDIGNSRIKWCLYDKTQELFGMTEAMPNNEPVLKQIFSEAWQDIATPNKVLVANVCGRLVAESLDAWVMQQWQVKTQYAKTEAFNHGVKNAYAEHHQLGVDRWLAIIAAWHRYCADNTAICVVDCGTATTIDGISATGQHLGGFILPGYILMQEALTKKASAINLLNKQTPSCDFSSTTEQAVNNGCYLAMLAAIERTVAFMQISYGEELKCIITGGNAGLVINQLNTIFDYEPDLVLHGLAMMLEQES